MKKYLVTDPCYVVPEEKWDGFLTENSYGESLRGEYVIPGKGVIIKSGSTEWGDGRWNVAPGKVVMADAGLVCIVELEEGYEPTAYEGTAVTDSKIEAEDWMDRVQHGGDPDTEEDWGDEE